MFTDQDVRSLAKVCDLGKTVADQLFPDEDPVGQTHPHPERARVRVVGVLKPKGFNLFGQDQDDTVIVPYTSRHEAFHRRARS